MIKKILFIIIVLSFSTKNFSATQILSYQNQFDLEMLKNIESNTISNKTNEVTASANLYTIYLKNSDPRQILKCVQELFGEINITYDPRTRAICLKCTEENYKKIYTIINKLDILLPQIKIKVQIIELTYQDFEQYKNIFSDIGNGFKINYSFQENKVKNIANFEGTLAYLIKSGSAKVLAQPTISTIDNNSSIIKVGDKIPYVSNITNTDSSSTQVNYLDTGIELEILPKISSNNIVLTEIQAKISNVKLWKEFKSFSCPILSTRITQTKVNIENKKTLVIAGLLDEEQSVNEEKVPIIGDIPWIGDFFKGKKTEKIKSDIMFLITPEIF